MPAPVMPRVFISYSSKDAAIVTRLREELKRASVAVWLDHEQLTPGTPNWTSAVRRGIEQATDVIYAASPDAADSEYVGHELAIARDESKRILPFWVRGEKWSRCAPMGYYYAQYIDGRDSASPAGMSALLATLGVSLAPSATPQPQPMAPAPAMSGPLEAGVQAILRGLDTSHTIHEVAAARPRPQPAATPRPSLLAMPPERFPERLLTLGFTPQAHDGVEWIIPPVCLVPAGPFRLGSDKAHDSLAGVGELNRRTVTLPAFEIARFPVTVAEYACFLADTRNQSRRQKPQEWAAQLQQLDHPVIYVSWYDAFDYAVWLAQRTQQPWRLSTEAEWEKAARCDPRDPLGASSQRIYPWGDRFAAARCNTRESGQRATTPVGQYGPDGLNPHAKRQSGVSPCGAEELAGNVWEWLATAHVGDYSNSEVTEQRNSAKDRHLRGGSWSGFAGNARAAFRSHVRPGGVGNGLGFRLARVSSGG